MTEAPPRLLLVYDGSTIADRALDVAIERARSSGASIVLLAVVPPRLWRARRGQFQVSPEKHDEEFALAQLARARDRCHAAGIHTDQRVRTGAPAHAIAEEAATGYAAIVMAERRSLTGAPPLARVVVVPDGTEVVVVA
jgi:nucleotide-binding universal stress UspA family protein